MCKRENNVSTKNCTFKAQIPIHVQIKIIRFSLFLLLNKYFYTFYSNLNANYLQYNGKHIYLVFNGVFVMRLHCVCVSVCIDIACSCCCKPSKFSTNLVVTLRFAIVVIALKSIDSVYWKLNPLGNSRNSPI